ncbi:lvivd repeat-containing protein, partial [Chrysochromulina tobinii]
MPSEYHQPPPQRQPFSYVPDGTFSTPPIVPNQGEYGVRKATASLKRPITAERAFPKENVYFRNSARYPAEISKVGADGVAVSYGVLPPGMRRAVSTFHGDVWHARAVSSGHVNGRLLLEHQIGVVKIQACECPQPVFVDCSKTPTMRDRAMARSVAVSGSYAYVVGESSKSLVVVDISNPATPVIRGSVVSSSLLDRAHFVAVSGSYAYVTAYLSDSLVVVDISNPASPVIRGSVVSSTVLDGAWGVAVSGSYAYVTTHDSASLVVVDISNPVSPVIRGSVASSSLLAAVAGVAVSGSYAYVTAVVSKSLVVVDAWDLDVSGSYAYVAGRDSDSLVVIDISNPASPAIRGSVVSSSLLNGANAVAVSGSYAYVAASRADGLTVVLLDLHSPPPPP